MEALRIVLTQTSANYRKEEADRNKMTYPLPPFSTVIGAIHKACGWTEYHPMELSIQGNYQSMHKEPYTDYCFLNTVMDDRGILVKVTNDTMLSSGLVKVASAKKSQGNSFRKGTTIDIYNESLLQEYRELLESRDKILEFKKIRLANTMAVIKKRKQTLKIKKKLVDKNSKEYTKVANRETEIKATEKSIKQKIEAYEKENYIQPYAKFKSLTTSLKYYEILNEIKLIIHVRADSQTLESILEHVYDIKSIGRSEDFVQVQEAQIVDLMRCREEITSDYSAYLSYEDVVHSKSIFTRENTKQINGTKYYINKDYSYVEGNKRRIFNKCKVVYASQYTVDDESENIWVDQAGEGQYIVNFM